MKKIILCITIFLVIPITSIADDLDTEIIDINEIIETSGSAKDEPAINSKSAIVFDRNTKCVLFSKNSDERRAIASTTKIMTAIIALENCSLSEMITVSKKSASVGGSRLGLNTGDKISMIDLIYGLMLRSRK